MTTAPPRIVLSGIYGRMGQALAPILLDDPRIELVGGLYAPHQETEDSPFRQMLLSRGVELGDSPTALLNLVDGVSVWLDFSSREGIRSNLEAALRKGVDALIGVTGFNAEELAWLRGLPAQTTQTIWWVPNFSLGMAVMNRIAAIARHHLGAVEILEMHHDRKLDAPSGSSRHTASVIAQAGRAADAVRYTPPVVEESSPSVSSAKYQESRGLNVEGIPIHSIRLPGLLAHQRVMFGGTGEVLTISHDTLDRSAFAEGIIRSVLHIHNLSGFQEGLELLMD